MRTRAKTDTNQAMIVSALRDLGATVQSIHMLGRGVPDLLVGWQGTNLLLEVKDGTLAPSRRRLTPDEAAWHAAWRGSVSIVSTVDEALALLRAVADPDAGSALPPD